MGGGLKFLPVGRRYPVVAGDNTGFSGTILIPDLNGAMPGQGVKAFHECCAERFTAENEAVHRTLSDVLLPVVHQHGKETGSGIGDIQVMCLDKFMQTHRVLARFIAWQVNRMAIE